MIDVVRALSAAEIDYMVIGGLAHIAWGSGRSTRDVDITLAVDPSDVRIVLRALGTQVGELVEDIEACLQNGVLAFVHRSGVHVDLMLTRHPYAQQAIDRAITLKVMSVPVKFCTPEDLVLHKIISERDKDRLDVADILRRRRETLDRAYLDPRVHELAVILERPEIEQRYLAALA